MARSINAKLKALAEESFVGVSNPNKKPLEMALEIVKDVIVTKQATAAAAESRVHKAQQKQKILEAIQSKKDEQLSQASIEDLTRQLAELGE